MIFNQSNHNSGNVVNAAMTEADNKIVCSRFSIDENATEIVSENLPNMAMTEQRAAELAEKIADVLMTTCDNVVCNVLMPMRHNCLYEEIDRLHVVSNVKRILMEG